MINVGGAKTWFTAAELAELKLPGLPGVKRKVNELADQARWKLRDGGVHCRPRSGRGGGLEYNISLLPPAASLELIRRGLAAPDGQAGSEPKDQLWAWFEGQTNAVKAEARRRLKAIEAVEALTSAMGLTVTAAIATVAASEGVSKASLYQWRTYVVGKRPDDRLPALAPRRVGGGAAAEIDAESWRIFVSDYLRPEKPTASSCYDRLQLAHEKAGRNTKLPSLKTFQRRLEREVDGRLIAAKRSGQDALRAMIPHQRRTVAELQALELVNIDGHKWDVFVRFPNGVVARPMMVAIQDVMSRKFLAWRIGETESAVLTRLAFADLFRLWGIPDGCLMDNGRAFASKLITGGATSRFRFKIRPEEPTGLLTALGVKVHWALPFRGSSKPIERGFRDFCDSIAKHPAFAGAYTGNKPDAKPENYGDRAIDLDVFVKVVAAGIAAHNARKGRRTEMARNGSFDDAFLASYQRAAIRRAGPEQMRLALLAADQVSTNRKTGEFELYGNRYCSEAMYAVAGQRVTVRFDPDHLQEDADGKPARLFVYDAAGSYVGEAEIIADVGFLDMAAAKTRARLEADLKRKAKALEAAANLLSADQLAALLPEVDDGDETPAPAAIRPVRASSRNGSAAVAAAPVRGAFLDRIEGAFAPAPSPDAPRLRVVE